MTTEANQPEAPSQPVKGDAWQEIDQVVRKLAALTESQVDASEFHVQVLDEVVGTLAAIGGVVWVEGSNGQLEIAYQINMAAAGGPEDSPEAKQHAQIAAATLGKDAAVLVRPRSGASGEKGAANPSDLLLVLCAWEGDATTRGVLEIFQRPGTSPAAQRGFARFLEVVCQIVADFHRNRQLADLQSLKAKWGRFERFSENVHRSLDLHEAAFHIANEARHYLECDRVWVGTSSGRRCRIVAASNVDSVNRRSNLVRALERLCRTVVATGEPLWHGGASQELPPEISGPLQVYVDTAHTRSLAIVPLHQTAADKPDRHKPPIGVLVVERFFADVDKPFQADVTAVSRHSELALANALELRRIPLARPLRLLGRARWFFEAGRLPLTGLAVVLIVVALTALAVIPADFEMVARGELQPVERKHIHAPDDGVVELKVNHGQPVSKEDELVVLSRPELDVEAQRILGELQATEKRLNTVNAELLQYTAETDEQRRRESELTAELEQLKTLVESLRRQYEIVSQQQGKLTVRSPLSGRVVSWNLTERLKARPVVRGDELMTVANLEGPWRLELRVPDRRMAHVLAAQEKIQPDLKVSFILRMDPKQVHVGRLASVGTRTEVGERDGAFVPVTVELAEQESLLQLVPGATVRARIYCGRRPIGYVWLHDLIDAFRTWVAF